MGQSWAKTGGDYRLPFAITDSTGALVNADSTPTVEVMRNNVTNGSWTITVNSGPTTGRYYLSGTVPTSYTVGDDISVYLQAVIGGVTTGDYIDYLKIVPANVFDSLVLGTDKLNTDQPIQYGVALSNLTFSMTLNRVPVTGATVTSTIKKGSSPTFGSTENSVVEIGNGVYSISLTATEMSASIVTLRFTASGCDDLTITIPIGS